MKKEVLPGMFIVIAIIMVMIMIFAIRPPSMLNQTHDITVVFERIAGLRESAAVWFSGVAKYQGIEVGKVKSIKIIRKPLKRPDTLDKFEIEVILSVNKSIPLTEGTNFRIATQGLAGYPHVEIIPGPPDSKPLDISKMARGITPPEDMFTTLQELSELVKSLKLAELGPKVHRAVENVGNLGEELTMLASDVRSITEDIKNKGDIQAITGNVRTLTDRAIITVDSTTETMKSANVVLAKVDGVIDENRDNIKVMIENFTEVSENLRAKIDETLTKVNQMVTNIDEFLKENKNDLREIFVNLRATTQNAKMFTQDIKLNPWKLFIKNKEKKPENILKPTPDKGPIIE